MSKKIIRKILAYIKNPRRFYIRFAERKLEKQSANMSDEEYIKKLYRIIYGKNLDLANPKTFNEKMQWLKLYNRNPIYTTMVDKHAVKEYVSKIIGDGYTAKEYGCWESFDAIDFSKLPNSFVLKTTHGCGGMVICKNAKETNLNKYREMFAISLKDNYYMHCREWPYKDVPPRIIAEEYLKTSNATVLPVYKFFCFNGEPFIAQVIQNDKCENETIDYVDMNWNVLKLKQNYPNSKKPMLKPRCFDEMKRICKVLTKNIPFVRCDLYEVENKIYFSEYTFFSDAGFEKFHPKKWDVILGEKIILPQK